MKRENNTRVKHDPNELIRCASCSHFRYFDNRAESQSPHALGRCGARPWDGNRGQWALFQHHCKSFVKAAKA
ncbi:MAG: hypothetical protein JRJ09_02650 [Deltaproteobacteria bacterium]|nr:hypothetical protein [Deltaproteobacteria bacterium]MBW2047411.1 hypothetical protein [Deltaproteobacteria bacterium]MBW2110421.1 hypothetical protein [Deltaproteobacteria bacterium]MBW2353003.1 hypothetical protein [Deltaproteobacteria bacterium]